MAENNSTSYQQHAEKNTLNDFRKGGI